MKVYGEPEVRLKEVKLDKLKVTCYGEAEVNIESGRIDHQKYLVYGESEIDASAIWNKRTKLIAYGGSEFRLSIQDDLKVSAIGESIVEYSGDPRLRKGLVLGENEIDTIR